MYKLCFRLDENLQNLDKYDSWQYKADGIKEKLEEMKNNLDKFDKPTSDVTELEAQKRFLSVRFFYLKEPLVSNFVVLHAILRELVYLHKLVG